MQPKYFATSLEHILAELKRINLIIQMHVQQAREVYERKGEFQGFFISKQEVEWLMKKAIGAPDWATSREHMFTTESLAKLDRVVEENSRRKSESAKQGVTLRLERLARLFDLTVLDIDILLICFAPEIDLCYERIYAYLHDDLNKKRPSVGLVAKILCPSYENQLDIRRRFLSEAPLVRHNIVYLLEDSAHQNSTFLNKFLKMDDRLVNYLLGFNDMDSRITPYVQNALSQNSLAELILATDLKRKLEIIADMKIAQNEGLIFYFQGPPGVGKESAAHAFSNKLDLGLLSVDGESVADSRKVDFDKTVRLILREASLQKSVLFWRGFDALLSEDKRVSLNRLIRGIEDRKGVTVLAGDKVWEPKSALHDRPFLRVEFPVPDYDQRLAFWNSVLRDHTHLRSDVALGEIANKFGLSGGQIQDAAATARNLACWRDPGNGSLSRDDLHTACRLQSNRKLATLARKITPLFKWADLILPADRLQQLREICDHLKYRYVVYGQWGFERKLSLGKGISVLFSGVPGTGKTMAAEILAQEMGLDLYKIDLSSVVSKYIGETEKNLSRIFIEAETSNAILFFDEADALFGKRSQVKDAHDRYANIEIGYLLQKMEEYEGLTILATNLRQNMDEAFVRRIRFIVDFPFPDEPHRYKIWGVHFTKEAPRSDYIDFEFLARQFKLAGGNIRNVVLNAAFLAASDDTAICMEHLIHATKREFQKKGKVCVKGDFGKYFEIIDDRGSA